MSNMGFGNSILFVISIMLVTVSCHHPKDFSQAEFKYLEIKKNRNTETDSLVGSILQSYRDSLSKVMNVVIGSSSIAMEKGKPESLLGNFVCDALRMELDSILLKNNQTPVDFFIFNNGGLRGAIPSGDITLRDIYQVMPFDNELVWVDLAYDSLISVVNYIRDKGGIPVSGIKLNLSDKGLDNVELSNGKPLGKQMKFRIGTNDFLALGGDGMNMLQTTEILNLTGVLVRDALIRHISEKAQLNKPIGSNYEGRIKP